MFSPASRPAFSIFLVLVLALTAGFAQTRPASQKPKQPQPAATTPDEPQDVETLKIDTNLVTVPVTITGFFQSYSAANGWCASAGAADVARTTAIPPSHFRMSTS